MTCGNCVFTIIVIDLKVHVIHWHVDVIYSFI